MAAYPNVPAAPHPGAENVFLYPAYPRCFKNVELLLQAADLLEKSGAPVFEVWLTIDGKENPYAATLRKRFGHLRSVRWLGFQSREQIENFYAVVGCLVFASKLETWGMPLSEFKRTGKQMLVADMPYAHETVGTYERVHFFAVDDPAALADAMRAFLLGTLQNPPAIAANIPQPFAPNWQTLFRLLLRQEA